MRIAWWLHRNIGMSKRERVRRAREAAARKTAYLLPREVAKWAAVRVMVNATHGEYENQVLPELLATDALARWGD